MTFNVHDTVDRLNPLERILATPALRGDIVEELVCRRLYDTELCLLSMTCRGFALAVRNFYRYARDELEIRDRAIDRNYCTRSLPLMLWYLGAVHDLVHDAQHNSLSRQAFCFAVTSRWTATIRDVQALMVRPINEALIRQGYLEDFKREFDKQASADHWYLGKVAINVDSTECVDFLLKSDLGLLCSKVLFQYAADQGCVKCLDLLYRHLWNSPHSTRSVDDIKRLLEVALFFALKNDSYDAAGFILNKLKQSTNQ
eukprot:gene12517-14792_t